MAEQSEWRKRANDFIAEMKVNPELMEFLVGMAQEPQGPEEKAPKGRQATKNDVDNMLRRPN